MTPCGGLLSHASVAAFAATTRGRLFQMNPSENNGGIFVREKILNLSILDNLKKQIFAIVDNYEGGFNVDQIPEVAQIAGCTETQARNAFIKLVELRLVKLNYGIKWVLNEDANWQEASR